MTDTTTIEIYTDQKTELDDLKLTDSESYKSVLQRLIESHSEGEGAIDETRVRELAREEIQDGVIMEALE
jgi:hypothetical protein